MVRVKTNFTVRDEFCIESRPSSCGMVIFGASGDLTSRKLIPALFQLFHHRRLSRNFFVLGCARSEMNDEQFRERMRKALAKWAGREETRESVELFIERLHYHAGGYDDPNSYSEIADRLAALDGQFETEGNRLVYLALPPNMYAPVADRLDEAGISRDLGNNGGGWARVIIEKPFGVDLDTALALDRHLHRTLAEHQIYRIDHYLGKETVQNILILRFANTIFEPVWNRNYIEYVQITVAEEIGVGHRAGYFEQAGVIRDMFQNHMLQMLALVAMEAPQSFEADRVRDQKVQFLRSIRPFPLEEIDQWILRGQYGPGSHNGATMPAYREEKGVASDSMVDTYLACRLMVDNWRWRGVPFYLRSGKALKKRVSEIAITFKHPPHSMFGPIKPEELAPNVLTLTVQPDEGMALRLQAKHPGPKLCMSAMSMDFKWSEVFGDEPGEAYERLLLDAMLGDQTLFVRHDDMIEAWSLITPVMQRWAEQGTGGTLLDYEPGTWGPKGANCLMHPGHRWRLIEEE